VHQRGCLLLLSGLCTALTTRQQLIPDMRLGASGSLWGVVHGEVVGRGGVQEQVRQGVRDAYYLRQESTKTSEADDTEAVGSWLGIGLCDREPGQVKAWMH